MKILAIDTAMPAVSACVFDTDSSRIISIERAQMERGQAEVLVPMLDRVVSAAGGFGVLERVAVSVGPGSFTGIRVGIAAARGIALTCNIPVVGVSTLAAFAAPLIEQKLSGVIAAAIDARHGKFWIQAFASNGRTILPPRLDDSFSAIDEMGMGPFVFAGNGAEIMMLTARTFSRDAEMAGEFVSPDIRYIARLGMLADPSTAPAKPLYLKAPDVRLPHPGIKV